jgi:hypothetical protein
MKPPIRPFTMLPAQPRWLNWLRAKLGGLYWLPCVACGKPYGSHERAKYAIYSSLYTDGGTFKAVCWRCELDDVKEDALGLQKHSVKG